MQLQKNKKQNKKGKPYPIYKKACSLQKSTQSGKKKAHYLHADTCQLYILSVNKQTREYGQIKMTGGKN